MCCLWGETSEKALGMSQGHLIFRCPLSLVLEKGSFGKGSFGKGQSAFEAKALRQNLSEKLAVRGS